MLIAYLTMNKVLSTGIQPSTQRKFHSNSPRYLDLQKDVNLPSGCCFGDSENCIFGSYVLYMLRATDAKTFPLPTFLAIRMAILLPSAPLTNV